MIQYRMNIIRKSKNRVLINKSTTTSFGFKPGDNAFITKINNIYLISKEPINKSKCVVVDKNYNIRFVSSYEVNNVGIFNYNIVIG